MNWMEATRWFCSHCDQEITDQTFIVLRPHILHNGCLDEFQKGQIVREQS